jgi:peptidoglycan/LPS O-acetylase OafA/YrhL
MDVPAPDRSIWSLLAGARFFFAMWVLAAHTYNFGIESRALPVPSRSGLVAVLCFLAISGFSIHHSINSQPAGYGRRRALRILPVHLVAVGITLIAYLFFGELYIGGGAQPMPSWWQWAAYFSLLNFLILPSIIDVLFPLWSLSIEAVYYTAAPFLRTWGVIPVLGAIVGSCAVLIGGGILNMQNIWVAPYGAQILVFAWAWLAGWLAYSSPRNIKYAALCLGIGSVGIFVNPGPFQLVKTSVYFWTFGSWAAIVLLLFFPPTIAIRPKFRTVLTYLGNLSFPLYVIHYPVLSIMSQAIWRYDATTNYGWSQAIVAISAAAIVLRYVDAPIRSRQVRGHHIPLLAEQASTFSH